MSLGGCEQPTYEELRHCEPASPCADLRNLGLPVFETSKNIRNFDSADLCDLGLPVLGEDGAPVRLGIMGGTFDPIHNGHLLLAEGARDALSLDAVLFLPTGNPHFKLGQTVRPAQDRLAMVRLGVADNPAFLVSDLEIRRPGVTYTYDTLRLLREAYSDQVKLFFLMGSDSLATLHYWKYAELLPPLATFVGVNRPSASQADPAMLAQLTQMGFCVQVVTAPALDISSTQLRQRLEAGQSVRYLVPDSVADYIDRTALYVRGEEYVEEA